jgi:predicted nucleic acid-binding protein
MLIDSSVIVKFFSEEPGWQDAQRYLYSPISIELSMIELASALLKKVRRKEFDESKVAYILARYPGVFRFIEQKRHIAKAFDIANKNSATVYDSLFIAAALQGGHELVTSDGNQAKIARKLGVKTIEC